ncbi:hypothetical protein SteCoe_16258 [Stentor coeruleus]|uniref:Uncharacterized protein n=1 Tax=Stentor coeruleus TaxID=5963 RepID=A0A1R2C1R4_9CILI|nr:hypothetical protein SteCoe_16258 [Stentor coeruleus]
MGCIAISKKKEINIQTTTRGPPVKNNDAVKEYFLENCAQMPKRIKELFDYVLTSNCSELGKIDLKFLNLAGKRLRPVELVLPYFSHIVYLSLWKTAIGDIGCENLAPCFEKLINLNFLCLADNRITAIGIVFISSKFVFLKKLEALELHVNSLQVMGATSLSKSIFHLANLKKIVLDECEIPNEAIIGLLEALSKINTLERMSLDYNQILDSGASLLLQLIPNMPNLKRIALQNAGISEELQEKLKNDFPHLLFSIA